MNKKVRILVSGKVQGVGFRLSSKFQAEKLSLTGFVANTDDGKVHIEIKGENNKVDEFIEWCKQGPLLARPTDVHVQPILKLSAKFLEKSQQPSFIITNSPHF